MSKDAPIIEFEDLCKRTLEKVDSQLLRDYTKSVVEQIRDGANQEELLAVIDVLSS